MLRQILSWCSFVAYHYSIASRKHAPENSKSSRVLMMTLGTQNGDGMHLLVITPEMSHRYGIVRDWCPGGVIKRLTDFAAV